MNKRGFQVNDSVREAVAWMWTSWNEALSKYTTRTGIPLPPVLTHKGLPIPKSSLVASMCRWVEEGHQRNSRAGVPEYRLQWKRVLKRVKTTDLLRNGYQNLSNPSLYWLFKGAAGERAIDKVLEGKYDGHPAPQLRQARLARRKKAKLAGKMAGALATNQSEGKADGDLSISIHGHEVAVVGGNGWHKVGRRRRYSWNWKQQWPESRRGWSG